MTRSETTSIPTNPRTTRPVGYAFVDVSTPSEAERAINELNGKSILDRKVSVQLARKPEPASSSPTAENAEAGEGQQRRRSSTRGRGRGRGRGGRAARGGRNARKTNGEAEGEDTNGPTNVPGQAAPLTATTNEALTGEAGEDGITADAKKAGKAAPRKQRGPPEDGVPSKTKIMVANLPYDLREEKVQRQVLIACTTNANILPAARDLLRLLAHLRQDRSPSHSQVHGSQAAGSQRASQGPWLRLRHAL